MKKIIMFTFVLGSFLGRTGHLQAMDPDVQLKRAQQYLTALQKQLQNLKTKDLETYMQKLVEKNIALYHAIRALHGPGDPERLRQDKEFAQAELDDLKNKNASLHAQYETYRQRMQNLKDQEKEVQKIERQQLPRRPLGPKGRRLPSTKHVVEKEERVETESLTKEQSEQERQEQEKLEQAQQELFRQEEEKQEQARLEQEQRKEKNKKIEEPKPLKKPSLWISPRIAAAGTALAIAATIYAGLKWHQRRRIVRTLARHDLKLTMLSPTQKNALAAAFQAHYRVPRSLRNLAILVRQPDFASPEVPAHIMWTLLADLYYRTAPTSEEIGELKAIVTQYPA